MKIIQLSAGQGPSECALAVKHGLDLLIREAVISGLAVHVLESEPGRENGTIKSVLVSIEPMKNLSNMFTAEQDSFLERWQGSMQWICKSPYRPNHGRKNWFFDAQVWELPVHQSVSMTDCEVKTCRASGAGGQHVNTTDSAVQITHRPTGMSVRIESERSQHQNRRLAAALLQHKLQQEKEGEKAELKGNLRLQHHQLERGKPKRVFRGIKFTE